MRKSLLPRLLRLIAFVGLALGAVIFGAPSPAQADGPGAWRVTEVSGEVRVRTGAENTGESSDWSPIETGDRILGPAVIVTGADGRVTVERAGDIVRMLPDSRLALPADATGGMITEIVQTIGEALFRVHKRPDWSFSVRTPYLAAVVKGTAFGVSVSRTGASVSVSEGRVGVSSVRGGGRRSADVTAGQRASVSAERGGLSIGPAPGSAAGKPAPEKSPETTEGASSDPYATPEERVRSIKKLEQGKLDSEERDRSKADASGSGSDEGQSGDGSSGDGSSGDGASNGGASGDGASDAGADGDNGMSGNDKSGKSKSGKTKSNGSGKRGSNN